MANKALKTYFKLVVARGSDRADVQWTSHFDSTDERARQDAQAIVDRFTCEHGIWPDKYWVASLSRITEEPLFVDTRFNQDN